MNRKIKHNTHPGEILKEDVIFANALTITDAASLLGISRPLLSSVLNRKTSITPQIATRIAKVFGGTAEIWIRLQLSFDMREAEQLSKSLKLKPFKAKKQQIA
jgi:addiction module HigA family antidote